MEIAFRISKIAKMLIMLDICIAPIDEQTFMALKILLHKKLITNKRYKISKYGCDNDKNFRLITWGIFYLIIKWLYNKIVNISDYFKNWTIINAWPRTYIKKCQTYLKIPQNCTKGKNNNNKVQFFTKKKLSTKLSTKTFPLNFKHHKSFRYQDAY